MGHQNSVNAYPRSKRGYFQHLDTRIVAFSKVRGVIYFVITTKIFNHSKPDNHLPLLQKDPLQNGECGIYSASNNMCFFLIRNIVNSGQVFINKSVHCNLPYFINCD